MSNVLDHGYVKLVETWGSDERVIEAARMSTDGGFVSWEPYEDHPKGDAGLLRYLWEHKHATPFEMAGMVIEVQAPIFVFREWRTHRTQVQCEEMFWDDSYSEMSARYTPLPDVNYVPSFRRCMQSGGTNKQAQGTGQLVNAADANAWRADLRDSYEKIQRLYEHGLKIGMPKELARLPIPVGRYSRMRASANLRNWLAFLTLRMDSAAQWEMQEYARAVAAIVEEKFPRSYGLWKESVA